MFLIEIKSADGTEIRQVLSNLDPDQYPGYYPLKSGETLSYKDTWMCRGRTNGTPPCPNPKDLIQEPETPSP